jgi:single-stranded-DNA-specific exonuclease
MKQTSWRIHQKKADFNELGKRLGVSPYIVRIMRNRGLTTYEEMYEFLNAGMEALHSPWLMKGMKEGVALLKEKTASGKKIHIIGDYDVDGVCSVAILYRALKNAGANVSYRLPHRIRDGYGMNMQMVKDAHEKGVDTILTCDNGIAALAEVELAKSLGMCVMVTDHHSVQEAGIPKADVVIDPHVEGETYPFPGICGAVVSWKIMLALYESLGISAGLLYDMTEFAGLATIQDSMELIGENRIIVKEAIRRIKNSSFPGIRCLMDVCSLKSETLRAGNLAFGINPCLNAGGRLDCADRALELLLCENDEDAREKAEYLKGLNDQRKGMQDKAIEDAKKYLAQNGREDANVLVAVLTDCHESLAGLVAGRLKEEYYRPCIILTKTENGLKGSARSIEGYNIFEELQKCKELLSKFGGHPMAAGLSLPEENADRLYEMLNASCTLTENELVEKVFADMVMPPYAINHEWVAQLDRLEPYGEGNPSPLFGANELMLMSMKFMGANSDHLKLTLMDSLGRSFTALKFYSAAEFDAKVTAQFGDGIRAALLRGYTGQSPIGISLMYEPLENEYRGIVTQELKIKDFKLKML